MPEKLTVEEKVERWRKRNPEDSLAVIHWLEHHDLELYCSGDKVSDVRKKCTKELGIKCPAYAFSDLRSEACRWWKQVRKRAYRWDSSLTEKSWLKVKRAVRELTPELTGASLDVAVEIVRSKVPCSHKILSALGKELIVWN